ncbi:uncharacterized protein LOC130433854 [Triplophysa dalaica]|uniref:uncharacterized protein LOC130433854 n=1 Tax=Triplophysa dalaica TaxID=1582913 RepID=UPI0024DFFD5E|nr:uncharacterized protein LOC130433854 [Triplophysa dalaica]XP_056619588.1 uncharacterized protein LOC130433854 [Triplophysa dalaica]
MKKTSLQVHLSQQMKYPLFPLLHVQLMTLSHVNPHPMGKQSFFPHKLPQRGCHGLKSSPFPSFSPEIEILVKKAMEDYNRHGSLLNVQIVKKDVMDHLVKAIYMYTSYPSGKQIEGVAEALIRKYPCLKEPGSFTGFQGWQMSLKYKMADYRRRLSKFGFPEVLCNTFKKKNPEDRKSAKSVKKPCKAEVNYLPQYPPGENQDSLEQERVLLLTEVKKKNNTIVVKDKMSRTFALRRHEVIELCPSVAEIKDRWPALFDVLQFKLRI